MTVALSNPGHSAATDAVPPSGLPAELAESAEFSVRNGRTFVTLAADVLLDWIEDWTDLTESRVAYEIEGHAAVPFEKITAELYPEKLRKEK